MDTEYKLKDTSDLYSSTSYSSISPRCSLVLASMDIGRVLADRGGVIFHARETCMYPNVFPGDVLTIQSRSARDVEVGDIAVCRTPGYLFGHRVIETGEDEGRAYIITRPDSSVEGSDGPTFDEDLLGVVVKIKRNGKPVPLKPKVYPKVIRYYYMKRLAFIEVKNRFKNRIINCLVQSCNGVIYGACAKIWYKLACPGLTYAVKVPLNTALGDVVYRCYEADVFDPEKAWKENKSRSWILSLHLNEEREAGAQVTFVRNQEGDWELKESHVRLRYSGLGFDKLLFERAEKIFASGARSKT